MIFLATLTLTLGFQVVPAAQSQQLSTVTRTSRFELRSDSRVALHHFLIDWAATDADEWPPYALPLTEREGWRAVLDPREQRVWSAGVRAAVILSTRGLDNRAEATNPSPVRHPGDTFAPCPATSSENAAVSPGGSFVVFCSGFFVRESGGMDNLTTRSCR